MDQNPTNWHIYDTLVESRCVLTFFFIGIDDIKQVESWIVQKIGKMDLSGAAEAKQRDARRRRRRRRHLHLHAGHHQNGVREAKFLRKKN